MPIDFNAQFIDSCRKGDLQGVKDSLKKGADIHYQKEMGFRKACANGHYQIVKYLVTSPEVKNKPDFNEFGKLGFYMACAHGKVDVVGLLLSVFFQKDCSSQYIGPILNKGLEQAAQWGSFKTMKYVLEMDLFKQFVDYSQGQQWFLSACRAEIPDKQYDKLIVYLLSNKDFKPAINIHFNKDEGFRKACEFGKLEIVKVLLSSSELKDHATINANNNEALYFACRGGYFDLLEYLTNPSNIGKVDLHALNDRAFKVAVENKQMPVIHYMLYDMNFQFSPPYMSEINQNNPELKNLIEKRDLFLKINKKFDERQQLFSNLSPKVKI